MAEGISAGKGIILKIKVETTPIVNGLKGTHLSVQTMSHDGGRRA